MVLQTINTNESWIRMEWSTAIKMRWPNMLAISQKIATVFDAPEIIAGNRGAGSEIINPATRPPEKELLVIRGFSRYINAKMSITFENGSNNIVVLIPTSTGLPTDYESLAKAIGPFVDNVEIQIYNPD